jgi:hypothetical protein
MGRVKKRHTISRLSQGDAFPFFETIYVAKLNNGVWTVRGSLPEGYAGGVAECEISKDTGEIISLVHGA